MCAGRGDGSGGRQQPVAAWLLGGPFGRAEDSPRMGAGGIRIPTEALTAKLRQERVVVRQPGRLVKLATPARQHDTGGLARSFAQVGSSEAKPCHAQPLKAGAARRPRRIWSRPPPTRRVSGGRPFQEGACQPGSDPYLESWPKLLSSHVYSRGGKPARGSRLLAGWRRRKAGAFRLWLSPVALSFPWREASSRCWGKGVE